MTEGIYYTPITLVAEISKYFVDIKCTTISKIIFKSKGRMDIIVSFVNQHNDLLYDVIIPKIFSIFYEVYNKIITEDIEVLSLKPSKEGGYYEFSGLDELTIPKDSMDTIVQANREIGFHVDTYVFDSKPEVEFLLQSLMSHEGLTIYFTGMFTRNKLISTFRMLIYSQTVLESITLISLLRCQMGHI